MKLEGLPQTTETIAATTDDKESLSVNDIDQKTKRLIEKLGDAFYFIFKDAEDKGRKVTVKDIEPLLNTSELAESFGGNQDPEKERVLNTITETRMTKGFIDLLEKRSGEVWSHSEKELMLKNTTPGYEDLQNRRQQQLEILQRWFDDEKHKRITKR